MFAGAVVNMEGTAVSMIQFHLLGSCQIGAEGQNVNKRNHISWSGGLSPIGNSREDLGR